MFIGNGNGAFADKTDQFGVRDGGWGWGAAAEDLNNSGRLSIVQVAGMLWSPDDVVAGGGNRFATFFQHFTASRPACG